MACGSTGIIPTICSDAVIGSPVLVALIVLALLIVTLIPYLIVDHSQVAKKCSKYNDAIAAYSDAMKIVSMDKTPQQW